MARLAVELLLKAGVTLVSNIKSQVLHRVARSTRADVMPSLDAQLLQQKIGFSPVFKQQKVRLANGTSKTLLVSSQSSIWWCVVFIFFLSLTKLGKGGGDKLVKSSSTDL